MADAIEQQIDALFAGRVEDFIGARDALVKKLKGEGDKDAAARVKALAKPTVAAHALNRIAREAPRELALALDAGKALATGKDFKGALEKQRAAVQVLTQKASAVDGADVPAIVSLLQGAAVDAALAARLREGRFSKLPDAPVGFFGAPPDGTVAAPPPPAPPKLTVVPKHDAEDVAARAKAKAELAAAEVEAKAAAADARKKKDEADQLETEAREAARSAAEARKAAKDAAARAEHAERHAAVLRRR